jgi:carbon-monoxide dehydrogenase medium subunit
MKPAPLRLVRARTLDDVWRAFADASGDAKVIAGGQSLVALLNLRLATPHTLIDLSGVDSLRTMTVSPSSIRIGAMVAQRVAEYDTQLRQEFPVLPRAVSYIGHPQIRSRGTIGGNVAHADPASELPALVLLADATLRVTGPHGSRDVPADQFFHGPYSTSVGDDEILERIDIGAAAIARRYAMHEIARCRGAFAMAGAIGSIGSTSADVRIALFGVGSTPISVDLGGTGLIAQWGDAGFDDALRAHYDDVLSPNDDFQATADQRRSYAVVCTKKVLHELLD